MISQARVYLKIKSGVITSSKISTSPHANIASSERAAFDHILKDQKLIHIDHFRDLLRKASLTGLKEDSRRVSAWLDLKLGKASDGKSP